MIGAGAEIKYEAETKIKEHKYFHVRLCSVEGLIRFLVENKENQIIRLFNIGPIVDPWGTRFVIMNENNKTMNNKMNVFPGRIANKFKRIRRR